MKSQNLSSSGCDEGNAASPPNNRDASSIKVLLVHDDATAVDDLKSIVAALQLDIVAVTTSTAAAEYARTTEFALALVKLSLCASDGLSMAEELCKLGHVAQLPIILIVTGEMSPDQHIKAYALGAVDVVVEPYPPEALRTKLSVFAGLYREKQQTRKEAQQFRLIVQGTKDYAIFMLDPHGRVATWNLGAQRLKGYEACEIVGEHFSRFYPQEAIERKWPDHELQVAQNVGRFEDEGWRLRKDGTHFWANVVITALWDEEGTLRGFSKVTRDLTARKRTEESLRRSEERYRLLVESVKDYAIFQLDPHGIISSWNAGAERIKGYAAHEIIGKHFSTFYPHEAVDIGWPEHELEVAKSVGRFEDEGWRIKKDGSRFWANVIITALRNSQGVHVGFSKITRDMTERKNAEENLRRLMEEALARKNAEESYRLLELEQERLRVTLDCIGDAVITTNADGLVQFLNPVAESLVRWSSQDAAGHPLHEVFNIVHETTRQNVENPALRALREGVIVGLANHTILIGKDGTERPIDDSAAPIRLRNGELIGSILVFRDVTKQKKAEAELRDLAAALSESGRRKDEFLATLAHELRNPLAPMRTALQLVRLSDNVDTCNHAHAVIERQLSQMVRLVDDLMDLSRITRGKLELRSENVDLSRILQQAIETSLPLIEQLGHRLELSMPEKPLYVNADITRLAQVFSNLLNNAAKYGSHNGTVDVYVTQRGSEISVHVRDDGIGIAGDQLSRIFEMFTQVDQSIERSRGGLGIGLTLVRRLVEMHEGRVEACSEGIGRGSEFIVSLPLVDAPSAVTSEVTFEITPPTSLRILVVDDNEDGARTLALMLSVVGNDTRVAFDGEAGVAMADQFRPEVILFDIGLPKMNGYEACRLIRQQSWAARTTIIALTGWGQEEDRKRSQLAGFDHHIVKPVDPACLFHLLAQVHLKTNQ